MQKPKKGHHYVQASYLAGFSSSGEKDGILHVKDIKTGKSWKSCCENVAKENGLYHINKSGVDINHLEDNFATGIERSFILLLRKIKSDTELPTDDESRYLLAQYIAFSDCRHPEKFQELTEITKGLICNMAEFPNKFFDHNESCPEFMDSPEKLKKSCNETFEHIKKDPRIVNQLYLRNGFTSIIPNAEKILHPEVPNLDLIKESAKCIMQRSWTLIIIKEEHLFFHCSDKPAIIKTPKRLKYFKVGYGLKQVSIAFPLSSKLFFIGTDKNNNLPALVAPKGLVESLNNLVKENSFRQVYSPVLFNN